MSTIYFVTGPAGVGKSTVSLEIAKSLNKSVLLEGDDFYHQVVSGYVQVWKDGNHLGIFWKVCIDTINNYLNAGYDVVFNYIISKDKLEELKKVFKATKVKFICLLVSEETLKERDKLRPEDCQMKERCVILLNNFLNYGFEEKHILYTDNLSVEETAQNIISNDRYYI